MPTTTKKTSKTPNSFALRLSPSVRLGAEKVSESEGVSLNMFFNIAIAEKVARLEHEHWVASRRPYDDAAQADALDLLSRSGTLPPDPGDEIPASYLAWRKRREAAEKAAARPAKKRA